MPMTAQYYLSELASQDEVEVLVSEQDFQDALQELTPSVSEAELQHYESVQSQFSTPQ
jgi:peroxin-6